MHLLTCPACGTLAPCYDPRCLGPVEHQDGWARCARGHVFVSKELRDMHARAVAACERVFADTAEVRALQAHADGCPVCAAQQPCQTGARLFRAALHSVPPDGLFGRVLGRGQDGRFSFLRWREGS